MGRLRTDVAILGLKARAKLWDMVQLAYLDGEGDGARSYATAWVVKGKAV